MVLQGSLTVEEVSWQKASREYTQKRADLSTCLQHGPSPLHNTWWHCDFVPIAPFLLDQGPQDWGSSFTGAFVTGMELKKLLSSGSSHPFEYPCMQPFLQGPFKQNKLLSYIWPVPATILQTDL